MADLPLWGSLQKSQDDPETIEEAISRIVADHESDPEAHLGDGESLENHKTEQIIDHPAGSVLADKNTFTEEYTTLNFEDYSLYASLGSVSQNAPPGMQLHIEAGSGEPTALASADQDPYEDYPDLDKDFFFQIAQRFTGVIGDFDAGIYSRLVGPSYRGFGFQRRGSTLKLTWDSASEHLSATITGVSLDEFHVLRAQYDATTKLLTAYNNGVQVGQLDLSSAHSTGAITMYLRYMEPSGYADDSNWYVRQVILAREY